MMNCLSVKPSINLQQPAIKIFAWTVKCNSLLLLLFKVSWTYFDCSEKLFVLECQRLCLLLHWLRFQSLPRFQLNVQLHWSFLDHYFHYPDFHWKHKSNYMFYWVHIQSDKKKICVNLHHHHRISNFKWWIIICLKSTAATTLHDCIAVTFFVNIQAKLLGKVGMTLWGRDMAVWW